MAPATMPIAGWNRSRGFRLGMLSAALAAGTVTSAQAYGISILSPSLYSANTATMDANLGLVGKTIEDFENTTLIAGLSIEYSNPASGPITTLPRVYAPGNCGGLWDGARVLVNTPQNNCWDVTGHAQIAERVTFQVGGVDFFGIALSNFQPGLVDHGLEINGVQVGTVEGIPNYLNPNSTGVARNGYLKIVAGAGESIQSVGFRLLPNTNGATFTGTPNQNRPIDGLIFDHLAIGAPVPSVPEPPTGLLLGCGALLTLAARRRKR